MGIRLKLSDIDIRKIGLKARAEHSIYNSGLYNVRHVVEAGRKELELTPGLGRAGLAQLEQIMADNGVTWESNPIDCLWGKPTRRRKPVQTKAAVKLFVGTALKPVVPTDVGTLAGVPRDEPEKVREANGSADKMVGQALNDAVLTAIDQWGVPIETSSEAAAFGEPNAEDDPYGERAKAIFDDLNEAMPGSTADDMAAVDASIEEQATLKLLLRKNEVVAQLGGEVARLTHELEHAGRFRACAEQQAAFLSERLTQQFTRLAGLRMFNGELTAQAAMTDIQANVEATDRVLHQILLQFDVNQPQAEEAYPEAQRGIEKC